MREAGKPVIASMGAVAASGGYYIACPADVIVALPATLTGSIGVVGGKLVTNNLLERVGLTTGVVEQGARSRMYSPRRGFTEEERERLGATIDAIYEDFVAKVAEGRHRTVPEIEDVARGRVWTGRDALGAGLVDELGGLRRAIDIARARAELPEDAPVLHPVHVPPVARLRRPRNSEDPRAASLTSTPLAAALRSDRRSQPADRNGPADAGDQDSLSLGSNGAARSASATKSLAFSSSLNRTAPAHPAAQCPPARRLTTPGLPRLWS